MIYCVYVFNTAKISCGMWLYIGKITEMMILGTGMQNGEAEKV